MGTTYEDAVAALYQAPLDTFVAERKRLAAELKANGDKAAAARLAKLARPTISAWAVNQLFWRARATFDELFAASHRLRTGDRTAASARREAMARLRSRAIALLGDAGHPAAEATLRRVATSLLALVASGGFDPDPPGALTGDRVPLGFEIAGLVVPESSPDREEGPDADDETERQQREEQLQRAEQERRRLAEEQARVLAERRRLEAALHVAKSNLETRAREVDEHRRQLGAAERMLEESRAVVADVEARLATLETPS
jgi:hypothetical protein